MFLRHERLFSGVVVTTVAAEIHRDIRIITILFLHTYTAFLYTQITMFRFLCSPGSCAALATWLCLWFVLLRYSTVGLIGGGPE